MVDREALFAQYESAIVSARDPDVADDAAAWSDPALFSVLRQASCAVLTAWNPGFLRPGDAVNARRNAQLRARLVLSGYEVWPALGASPDGAFSEPGFLAWEISLDEAVFIARGFDQFAIYWYDETGERSVVAC
ncbi:MAG: DUF3293 domain-containing protein [Candidatus Nanopelagicales bacterium]